MANLVKMFSSTLRDIIYQTLDFQVLDFQLRSFVDPKPVELRESYIPLKYTEWQYIQSPKLGVINP